MPLIETLTVGVGAGIAKGIAKLWLRDLPVVDSAAASLVDVLKSATDDFLAGLSGESQSFSV